MPEDSFQLECDRLSHIVDGVQFEYLRWERNEGPMLARLVVLAHSALEARSEFELTEEGATRDIKRFVLKVHGKRIVGVTLRVEAGRAVVEGHALERSPYGLSGGSPITAGFDTVDEPWMAGALQDVFGRIRAAA